MKKLWKEKTEEKGINVSPIDAKPLAFALKQIMDKQTYTDDQFTGNRFSFHVYNALTESTNLTLTEEKKKKMKKKEKRRKREAPVRFFQECKAKAKVKNTIK